MKIVLTRSYKKLNKQGVPTTVFVYEVQGTEAQLKSYEEAQGEFYREDEAKHPIFFSTSYIGEQGKLLITSKGKCIADTSDFDKAASLTAQYGGNFGQALANSFAGRLLGAAPKATEEVLQPVEKNDRLD